MADIRHIRRHLATVYVAIAALLLAACSSSENPSETEGFVSVPMQIDVPAFRSFTNDQTHHVNRILLLPFIKTSESLTDDNSNFVPAYQYALQKDINQFPSNTLTLHLASGSTYKVLVIGYNQTDYDFKNRTSPANRFDFGAVTTPVTLDNFCLIPKSPAAIPEFFSCVANVYNGSTPLGRQSFKPEDKNNLQGALSRVVSGLSVTITGVPDFVRTMTLRAENLVKSTAIKNNGPATWQTTGDGGNRILGKVAPVSGTVAFNLYLLPTLSTYKTALYLDVELGGTTQTHQIVSASGNVSGAVTNNQFIFNPNEATNLTGTYATINLGFKICYGINLDDDAWDGYHNNNEGDD